MVSIARGLFSLEFVQEKNTRGFCRISAALRHAPFQLRFFGAFYGLGKATMDAMLFTFNRYPISQAGRRGFDPRLPLSLLSSTYLPDPRSLTLKVVVNDVGTMFVRCNPFVCQQ
jgi:hypothetical protein